MNNPFIKLSKKILLSTSIISLVAGLSINSSDATNRITNSNTDITNGSGFIPEGFNDGDDLTFGGLHTVSFTTNPNHIINVVDFNGFDGVMSIAPDINLSAANVKSIVFPFVGAMQFLGSSTVSGRIGFGGKIKEISIGEGVVEFTGDTIAVDNMNLSVAGSTVKFSGPSEVLTDLNINNTSGNDGSGTLLINSDTRFVGNIGANGAQLNNIIFTSDSLIKYANQNNQDLRVANIKPDVALGDNKGSILLWYNGEKNIDNKIGLPDLKLKLLAFSGAISDDLQVDQTVNIKAGNAIYANKVDIFPFNLTNFSLHQSTLNIETNTIVNGLITTTPIGGEVPNTVGIINVQGSSTLTGGIGEIGNIMPEVHFNSNDHSDVLTFTGDIHAGIITQDKPNLTLPQDTLFAANESYTNQDSTHSIGLNTFTIRASGSMNGTETLNFSADDTKAGRIVIDGGTFVMNGLTSMDLKLVDLTTTLPPGGEKSYIIFGNPININGGTISIPSNEKVNFSILSSTNPFVQWAYSNGVITQKVIPDVGPVIIDAGGGITGTAKDNLVIIANSDSGVRSDLVNAIITGNAQELLDRLQIVITEVTEDSFDIIEDLIGDISANINHKTEMANLLAEETSLQGISAGDAAERFGAWVSYSYSENRQGKRGEKPGYKSRSNGFTVGADTLINDETAIGLAIGYIDTKVNHKDSNIGDTSSARSILLSIYSITELLNNWYVQAQAIIGRTKINNTELRGTSSRREYAKASFYSNAYAAEVETGYHYLTENKVMVTPIIGLEFDVIGKSHYQETGTTTQNLNVHKSAQQKLIGHTGVIFAKNYKVGTYSFIPEIYGIVRHDFINKNLKVVSKLDGVEDPLITRTAQNVPTFYNIGLGITSAIKNTEVTLGYDHYFGEKYSSHQGTMKVRVNF